MHLYYSLWLATSSPQSQTVWVKTCLQKPVFKGHRKWHEGWDRSRNSVCRWPHMQGSNSRLQGNWYGDGCSLGQLFMSKEKTGIPMLCHYYFCKLLHKQKCTKSTVSLEFLNAKVTVFVPIISTHKKIFSPELWQNLSQREFKETSTGTLIPCFFRKSGPSKMHVLQHMSKQEKHETHDVLHKQLSALQDKLF